MCERDSAGWAGSRGRSGVPVKVVEPGLSQPGWARAGSTSSASTACPHPRVRVVGRPVTHRGITARSPHPRQWEGGSRGSLVDGREGGVAISGQAARSGPFLRQGAGGSYSFDKRARGGLCGLCGGRASLRTRFCSQWKPGGLVNSVSPGFVRREVGQLVLRCAQVHFPAFHVESGAVSLPARVSIDPAGGAELARGVAMIRPMVFTTRSARVKCRVAGPS